MAWDPNLFVNSKIQCYFSQYVGFYSSASYYSVQWWCLPTSRPLCGSTATQVSQCIHTRVHRHCMTDLSRP